MAVLIGASSIPKLEEKFGEPPVLFYILNLFEALKDLAAAIR